MPVLEEGAGVVTSRGDVHYVVTEYGVADLWGKSIRERALALIEIAHPDFRAELLAAAKARRYVFPDQLAPRAPRPWETEQSVDVPDRERVIVRPLRMSDVEPLRDMLYRLSADSVVPALLPAQEDAPARGARGARRSRLRSERRARRHFRPTVAKSSGWAATTSTRRRSLPTSPSSWPTPGKTKASARS